MNYHCAKFQVNIIQSYFTVRTLNTKKENTGLEINCFASQKKTYLEYPFSFALNDLYKQSKALHWSQ